LPDCKLGREVRLARIVLSEVVFRFDSSWKFRFGWRRRVSHNRRLRLGSGRRRFMCYRFMRWRFVRQRLWRQHFIDRSDLRTFGGEKRFVGEERRAQRTAGNEIGRVEFPFFLNDLRPRRRRQLERGLDVSRGGR
jgi:hypothetical protein